MEKIIISNMIYDFVLALQNTPATSKIFLSKYTGKLMADL